MTLLFQCPVLIIGKSGTFAIYRDGKRYFCKMLTWNAEHNNAPIEFYLDEVNSKAAFPSDKELIAEQIIDKIRQWNNLSAKEKEEVLKKIN
jgi:hypothetical protein